MAAPLPGAEHFSRTEEFVGRKIAGETVLVPLRQQIGDLESIYTLNEVGSFIWERLDGNATVSEIALALEAEFEAEPTEIRSDLEVFLAQLLRLRAIHAGSPTDPTPPPPVR